MQAIDALRSSALRLWEAVVAHHRVALATAAVVAAATTAGVAVLPDRYEANARLVVDTQTALKPLMEGLTFQENIDQQLRMLARTLITRPNVERIVDASGIAPPGGREAAVARVLRRLQVVPAGAENVYEIRYRDTDPRRAQAVVQATLDLFVREGIQGKQRDTRDAGRFIDEQIREAETKLSAAEDRLKEFKKRHFGLTGVSSQDYFARISALSEDVGKLRIELGAAIQQRNAYRREIEDDGMDPLMEAKVPPPGIAELQARIDAQQKLVDDLRLRYTDAHPDLVNGRRNLAELQAEMKVRRAEFAAQARTSSGRRSLQAGNPLYQKLRASLAEAEAQVAGLQAQLATKQASLEEARAAGSRLPQVEAELVQLNRDYDVIRKNYDALVARREAAGLAAKLDQSSRLADFRIVEPTRVSDTPVFPSRSQLAWAALLLTVLSALGAVQLLRTLRPTLDDALSLVQLTGRPVIASLSLHAQEVAQQVRGRAWLWPVAATVALLLLQAGWAAWISLKGQT